MLMVGFSISALNAQKRNNTWVMFSDEGLDFNYTPPRHFYSGLSVHHNTTIVESVGAISSPTTGKLLFYASARTALLSWVLLLRFLRCWLRTSLALHHPHLTQNKSPFRKLEGFLFAQTKRKAFNLRKGTLWRSSFAAYSYNNQLCCWWIPVVPSVSKTNSELIMTVLVSRLKQYTTE